jgi:hypothetical protein
MPLYSGPPPGSHGDGNNLYGVDQPRSGTCARIICHRLANDHVVVDEIGPTTSRISFWTAGL